MKTNFKIIIADDHKIICNGIKQLIDKNELGDVIAMAHNGKNLLDKLNSCSPNLIILDINMPELNGIDAATVIKNRNSAIKILVISMHNDFVLIDKLKKLGINGFLSKDFEEEEFLEAICTIYETGFYFKQTDDKNQNANSYNLTPREIEIIRLISDGFSTKEISQKLSLSVFTIDTHRKNIRRKTGAKSAMLILKLYEDSLKFEQ